MRIKPNLNLSVNEISNAWSLVKNPLLKEALINGISTDTRELRKGDLFFALPGENFNGEDFIKEAKRKGAYTVSSQHKNADFFVNDTVNALNLLANYYKRKSTVKTTVAITGSVGKTTTKDLTAKLLSNKYNVHSTYKNYNNEIGVPLTVLSAERDSEILVIEAGMNHSGELGRISHCIEPDISVITKIGSSHIGNLGSRENIAKAKSEIFLGMKKPYAIIPHEEKLLSGFSFAKTVSTDNDNADFFLSVTSYGETYTVFDYRSKYNKILSTRISTRSAHIPECLAFALAVASSFNMSNDELYSAILSLNFSFKNNLINIGNLTLIDDSYNSSPESLKMAFKTLNSFTGKVKSAVLGDILELGSENERIHLDVGKLAAEAGLSKLYIFGENAKYISYGALSQGMSREKIFINENINHPEVTAEQIINNSSNEVLLFKASRKINLERIIEILKVNLNEAN